MGFRRAVVVLIVLLTGLGLGTLLLQVLAPGGWTAAKLVMLAAFAGTAPWTGLCLANGLIGFLILVARRDPVRAVVSGAIDDRRNAAAHRDRDDGARRGHAPRAAAAAAAAA